MAMRIDLGCGRRPHRDCQGIDRVPYDGVALQHDFDKPLPLENDSVEFVMAADSLQYARNLRNIMKELYRVCRHKAVVCIVAPYAHATPNMVNPEFRHLFNEHSPRYWTRHRMFPANMDEFYLSPPDSWSLLQGERVPDEPDFRLVRLEMFYYPPYQRCYDPEELAILRQSQLNVAHKIMFHLVAVKAPMSDEESERLGQMEPEMLEEPEWIGRERAPVQERPVMVEEQPFSMEVFEPLQPLGGEPAPQKRRGRRQTPRTSNVRKARGKGARKAPLWKKKRRITR